MQSRKRTKGRSGIRPPEPKVASSTLASRVRNHNPRTAKKKSGCLRCGGETNEKILVGVALGLLADQRHSPAVGPWLVSSLMGFCSTRCADESTIAPLVAVRLLGGP